MRIARCSRRRSTGPGALHARPPQLVGGVGQLLMQVAAALITGVWYGEAGTNGEALPSPALHATRSPVAGQLHLERLWSAPPAG